MTSHARLLGLAFASADTLVEIDGTGVIRFAMGAAPAAGHAPERSWQGRRLDELFEPGGAARVEAALQALVPGARSESLELLYVLGGGGYRRARLRIFSLPELAPHRSCALTWQGEAFVQPDTDPSAPVEPLLGHDALLRRADTLLAEPGAAPLSVTFVDVDGMDSAKEGDRERLSERLNQALRAAAFDGRSAAHLAGGAYALLRHDPDTRAVEEAVRNIAALEGLPLSAEVRQAELSPSVDRRASLRAMRHALEVCITHGGLDDPDVTFQKALDRTLNEMQEFRAMVKARQFTLHYQPIVALGSGALHHFEALARLPGREGPEATIRMAESLDLIDSFDLAVAEMAIRQMMKPGHGLVQVAINVSTASLASDTYVQALTRLTANHGDMRRRLSLEITETAAIQDMEAAHRRLSSLREAGFRIYLDDFGVGSATFDYLNRLPLDGVKIDGAFVMRARDDEKPRTLIRHLAELCGGLGLNTVAERVETGEMAELMLKLGVTYGQGWFFGRPEPEPRLERPRGTPARRQGTITGWA